MFCKLVFALAFAAAPTLARALETVTLPIMAQDSHAFATVDSPWKGDVFARSPFGFSPFGFSTPGSNASFTSLNRKLDDNLSFGVRSTVGFSSSMTGHGLTRGYGFSATEVKFARTSGNMRTWMSASFGSMTPNRFGGPLGLVGDPANPMFTGVQNPSFARAAAGVDIAISNNVTLGLGVSVGTANGLNNSFNNGFGRGFGGPLFIGR